MLFNFKSKFPFNNSPLPFSFDEKFTRPSKLLVPILSRNKYKCVESFLKSTSGAFFSFIKSNLLDRAETWFNFCLEKTVFLSMRKNFVINFFGKSSYPLVITLSIFLDEEFEIFISRNKVSFFNRGFTYVISEKEFPFLSICLSSWFVRSLNSLVLIFIESIPESIIPLVLSFLVTMIISFIFFPRSK